MHAKSVIAAGASEHVDTPLKLQFTFFSGVEPARHLEPIEYDSASDAERKAGQE